MSQKWTSRLDNDLRDSGEMRGFLGKPHTCVNDCLHAHTSLKYGSELHCIDVFFASQF